MIPFEDNRDIVGDEAFIGFRAPDLIHDYWNAASALWWMTEDLLPCTLFIVKNRKVNSFLRDIHSMLEQVTVSPVGSFCSLGIAVWYHPTAIMFGIGSTQNISMFIDDSVLEKKSYKIIDDNKHYSVGMFDATVEQNIIDLELPKKQTQWLFDTVNLFRSEVSGPLRSN